MCIVLTVTVNVVATMEIVIYLICIHVHTLELMVHTLELMVHS